MTAPTGNRQRFWIRATLVAGMLLATLGLVAVVRGRPHGHPNGPTTLARTDSRTGAERARADRQRGAAGDSIRVRVEDARGRIVRHARVFVDTAGGARPAQARWSPDDGVLMLPRRARPHDLRVLARGFRIQGARGVGADHTIRLKRGYLLRVTVRDAPTDGLPRHLRIMLRVRPILGRGAAPGGVDARTLIDLMDNLGGPGPKGFARGDFGYPVSLAQAQSGILLPLAGRYHVRWGLIDLRTRTWFGLDARCGRDVTIVEGSAPAHAGLTILPEDLQATLAGLTRSEAEAGALADK